MRVRGLRWSDENGPDAKDRNVGRLALAIIPAALGGAGVLWVLTVSGCLDLSHEQRLERRTLQTVGIVSVPKAPVVLVNHDAACLKVESSLMDGDKLVIYVRNKCSRWLEPYPNYSYRVEAHNGSVIDSGRYAFDGDKAIAPNELREQQTSIKKDDRIERVQIYAIDPSQ